MNQMKETLGCTDYIVQRNTDNEAYVFKPIMPVIVVKDSGKCQTMKRHGSHKI